MDVDDDENDDVAREVGMKVERRFSVPKRQITYTQGKVRKYTCKLTCLEDGGFDLDLCFFSNRYRQAKPGPRLFEVLILMLMMLSLLNKAVVTVYLLLDYITGIIIVIAGVLS